MGAVHLACSTLGFSGTPLAEAFARIRALGFAAADLGVFPREGFGHVQPAALRAGLLAVTEEVLQAMDVAGITVAALNAAVSDDPAAAAQEANAVCLFAHRVGARVVTLSAGRGSPAEAAARLAPALDAAYRARVVLAVENHANTAAETPEGVLELLTLLPGLRLTFDPSHALIRGDALAAWRPALARAAHVHLRDAGRNGWPEVQAPWGRGALALDEMLSELDRADYAGTIAVEYLRPGDVGDGAADLDPAAESVKAREAVEAAIAAGAAR